MISTHILDTSIGRPAAGVAVTLETEVGRGEWRRVASGHTDADGRLKGLQPDGGPGGRTFRLVYETADYFRKRNVPAFFPVVIVVFDAADADQNYHVPLLLNPFGYTTYRGS